MPLCLIDVCSKGWMVFAETVSDLSSSDAVSDVTRKEGAFVSESHYQVTMVIVSGS